MGSSNLLYVTGIFFLFLLLNANLNRMLSNQSTNAIDYYTDSKIRNIATSMSSMVLSKISDDLSYRAESPVQFTLFEGTGYYTASDTVIATDTVLKITVVANYDEQTKVTTTLCGKWKVPPAFTYSVASGGNTTMSGGAVIRSNDATKNVNIYTNSSFALSGANTKVIGTVSYYNTIVGNTSNILPVSGTTGPAFSKAPAQVSMPTFNPDDYLSIATQVYTGDLSVSGTLNLGTKTNPGIIYVGGNLSMGGGATITGFGIFVVKGTITMTGGTTFINSDPNVSNFAFYAVGDIKVSGGSMVYGQMLTQGNASFTGGSSLGGTIAAKGTVTMQGGASLDIPVSAELVSPIWGNKGKAVRLIPMGYYE